MPVMMASRSLGRLGARRLGAFAAPRGLTGIARMSTYRYLASHEYVVTEAKDGKSIAKVGISDFAQTQLGDIVFVDLPVVGDEFKAGDSFGSVESVKAASDVFAPVSGTVVSINEALDATPELVNEKAMTDGWFVELEMTDESELDALLGEEDYKAHCDAEESGH